MFPQPMPRSDFPSDGPLPDLTSIIEQHLRAGFQPDLALDLVLNELVIRAAEATRASSAALALARGDELVCRAATGNFAPDLGVPLNPREGLSGVCLRTREPQLSVDTELDPRIAVSFARRFGIRSVLAVPVFDVADGAHFTGVLEVFSPTPAAFSRADQRVLEAFAGECARVRHTALELDQPKAAGQPTPELTIAEITTLKAPSIRIPTAEKTSESRTPVISITEVPPAEIDEPEVDERESVSSEPPRPEVIRRDAVLPSLASVSRPPAPPSTYEGWSLLLGTVAILAIVAVSFLIGSRIGWLRATVPPNQNLQPAPSPAPAAPTEISLETGSADATVKTKSKSARKETKAATADRSATSAPSDGELVVYERGKVVFRMKNPPGAAEKAAETTSSADTASSNVAGGTSSGAEAATRTSATARSVWLNPAEAEDRLVNRIEPKYPLAARVAHKAGDVVLEVDVAEDGSVSSVRTLKGDPVLAGAATEAVRNWRYEPYRLHDRPSQFHTDVTLSFAVSN